MSDYCSVYIPLSRYNNRLARSVPTHSGICVFSDSEQMGLQFPSPSTTVCLNDFRAIEGDALEGIHGNKDNSTVGINTMLSISVPNGM